MDDAVSPSAFRAATAPTSLPGPRILMISAGVYPPDFGGGQLRVHQTLLRLRGRLPLDVRVLALSGASCPPGEGATDGITVRRLPAGLALLRLSLAVRCEL